MHLPTPPFLRHVRARIALKTGPALSSNTENDGRKRKYVCHEEDNSMTSLLLITDLAGM